MKGRGKRIGLLILVLMISLLFASLAPADPLDNWLKRVSNTQNNLQDIVYAKSIFVTVGDNGTILTSSDGIIWIQRASGTTNNLSGVTYQDNKFFALGNSGTMLVSSDGINWTAKTLEPTSLYDIIYANSTYVIGGWDYIATSTDLLTWVKSSQPQPEAYTLAYGNGLFLYGGEIGDIQTSTDGMIWTVRKNNGCYIGKIIYVNGKFYAVGCLPGPDFSSIGYISNDGIVWTEINALKQPSIIYSDIIYGNNIFVTVGSYGNLKTSTDGITWISRTTGDTSSWAYSIAYGNNSFVVVGDKGTILQSGTVGTVMADINNDGIIDISDVILVLRMALKIDPIQPCSDLNNDGIVDISDVILTLRMALKIDPLQQCI